MWPTNPHATVSLSNFKDAVRQYVDHIRCKSAYNMLYHVSDNIEMVDKNYGGRIFTVPSVGIVFRWVEDANYSEQVSDQPWLDFPIVLIVWLIRFVKRNLSSSHTSSDSKLNTSTAVFLGGEKVP